MSLFDDVPCRASAEERLYDGGEGYRHDDADRDERDREERDEDNADAFDDVTRAMMWVQLVDARASMRAVATTLGDSFQARLLTDAVREIDELIGPAQAASS